MYIWEFPIFAIMGIGAGLMGSSFVFINVRLNRLRQRYMPWDKSYRRVIEVTFQGFQEFVISNVLRLLVTD